MSCHVGEEQIAALVAEQDNTSVFERTVAEQLLVINAGYIPAIAAGTLTQYGLALVAGAMAFSSVLLLAGAFRERRITQLPGMRRTWFGGTPPHERSPNKPLA